MQQKNNKTKGRAHLIDGLSGERKGGGEFPVKICGTGDDRWSEESFRASRVPGLQELAEGDVGLVEVRLVRRMMIRCWRRLVSSGPAEEEA